jgi:hypothetical protein
LQLTYTTFSGAIFIIVSNASLSQPRLGGSTNITSALTFCFSTKSFNAYSTSPVKNSAFSIPFNLAFSLASIIAASTVSIPYNFLTLSDAKIPIVPIPQYKSNTVSSPVSSARSTAF